jgi:hypothetical protein
MMRMSQGQDLRGDRGGNKEKKKPKAQKKPAKGAPQRESMVPPAPAKSPGSATRPPRDTSDDQ